MLSGVRLSCYQEYGSAANPIAARVSVSLNFPNLNALTVSSSAAPRWTTTESADERHHAQQQQPGFLAGRARP
ncbi:MAG: hypothetical protein C0435_16350 [Ralstonia sp.]|nr:hypothetical protein [Ralstonia sp.]MBA4297569.1 hypothetical protein [Ralstonia sp.]